MQIKLKIIIFESKIFIKSNPIIFWRQEEINKNMNKFNHMNYVHQLKKFNFKHFMEFKTKLNILNIFKIMKLKLMF